jgi:hypothetical protein
MLNLLLGILLGGTAVGVLALIGALLFAAASGPLGGFLERRRFATHAARAAACDEMLRRGRIDEALPILLSSFYLATLRDRSLSSAVTNHHTALLSRLIAITSDGQGGTVRLLSLAKTDRLLAERAALQKRYFALAQGATHEKRQETRRKLAANRRELQAALAQLIEEVRSTRQPERYH